MKTERRRYNAHLWRVLTNETKDTTVVVKIYQIRSIAIYHIERYENGEFTPSMALNGETNAWQVAMSMLEGY